MAGTGNRPAAAARQPLRLVSLIPSATEIVCALGLEERLVGRSHECDYPPSVRPLPACTTAKLRSEAPSAEIDRQVQRILEEALSVYQVDTELLRSLRPTHILTQTQCEVCAVSLRDVEQALSAWMEEHPQILALQPVALADVWEDIRRLAAGLGVPERGHRLVQSLQSRMDAIAQAAAPWPRPSVACIEWMEPLMASGNWMPELVAMAGGRNLFGESGRHASWLEWKDVVAADPDILLILPCGFDLARIRREMPALTERPGWKKLKSANTGSAFLLDGNQYFNRPGPRLAESLEILAEILHPEAFPFRHQGSGWARF
ncbi:MAG TPA: cobalamin-binding protein [Terriglobia bacterium]|nr:cobalamin-binding protein [Terriglobia bacterium]